MIRELCSFEGRLAGTDAERRPPTALAERLRDPAAGSTPSRPTSTPSAALVHAAHCLLGVRGQPCRARDPAVGFALVLARRALDVPRPQRPLLPVRRLFFRRASQNVVSRAATRRPRSRDPLRALRRRPDRRASSTRRARRFARASRGAPPAARPLPHPLLVARAASPAARRTDGRARLRARLGAPAPPHPRAAGRRLRRSSTSQLSDVVPGANDNASGVATASRSPASSTTSRPTNLDVWVVLDGGEECLQEGMRASCARTAATRPRDTPSSSTSTPSATARSASRPRRRVVSYAWIAAWSSSARRSPSADAEGEDATAPGLAHGLGGDAMPPRLRASAISRHLPRRRRLVPHRHLPVRHCRSRQPRRARPRPRLRPRADPPARRRRRPRGPRPGNSAEQDRGALAGLGDDLLAIAELALAIDDPPADDRRSTTAEASPLDQVGGELAEAELGGVEPHEQEVRRRADRELGPAEQRARGARSRPPRPRRR